MESKQTLERPRTVADKIPGYDYGSANVAKSPITLEEPLSNWNIARRYSERSGLRFQQWVLDTCLRPYDQDWLNYQQEMALRHTSVKKNKTDNVRSAPTIHLRHVIAFNAVLGDPNIIKPFLAKNGHSASDIEKMHQAWSKSLWLQAALWSEPYTDPQVAPNEW